MGRVRLHAGGISTNDVRLGLRGASERLRPAGDDINDATGPDQDGRCGWCGSRKKVDVAARPRRCGACQTDERTVADVNRALLAGSQPPLGAPAPATGGYSALRRRGDAARERLKTRKKNNKAAARPGPAPRETRAQPSAPRRVTTAQKQAGETRLRTEVAKIERKLEQPNLAPGRQADLREDIAAARRLLKNWNDDIH
jgi:hypothetical protein